ncbi:nucleotidyltransferase domain-containing protein [Candidatus Woesearchaeota archaeon]|nr:nucleotidyltransferase domain-containing protein [Candidatus Woesearchaeota archaeon]
MLTENQKKVLKYIMVNYSTYPSINKIAKECSLTPNGAYKILKKFEKEGILNYKQISNIKSYYLNYKNNKTKNILELALISDINIKRINYRKEDLKQLRAIAKSCILFGSYIENKKEPNDLDVLFILEKKDFKEYKKRLNEIKEILPVKIHDMIQTNEDLINNIKKRNEVILKILEKGIILWGFNDIIEVFLSVGE